MQFLLSINKGKAIRGSKEIQNYLKTLNGEYLISINEHNNLTTVKQCRDAYFFKVDLVVQSTGSERYNIHNEFKNEAKIVSTKDFTVIDWKNFIKKFQNYIYEKLDILI